MSQPRICIIDYGLGNIRSLANALKEVGVQASLSSHREEILEADGCILPGVGAFAYGMRTLQSKGLDTTLHAYADSGKPLLGICLGMQLMMESSEEFGSSQGLGLIPGDVLKLGRQQERALRLPHVCWNDIVPPSGRDWDKTILSATPSGSDMYFVHSFAVSPSNSEHTLAETTYDGVTFCSAIQYKNVIGVQFHPEKSGVTGLKILQNFMELV